MDSGFLSLVGFRCIPISQSNCRNFSCSSIIKVIKYVSNSQCDFPFYVVYGE